MRMPILFADAQIAQFDINLPSQIKPLFNKSTNYGYTFLGNIIELLLFIAVFLAFGYIIFGGVKWIISQGDPKNLESARNTIIFAAIGLGVAAASVLIINVLAFFFNVPLLGCFINCT